MDGMSKWNIFNDVYYNIVMEEQKPSYEPPREGKDAIEIWTKWKNRINIFVLPKKVLDFGCGIGKMKPIFEADGWDYTGFDLFSQNDCLVGDMHFTDIGERFDLIFSLQTLEHSPFPIILVKRIYDHLIDGCYAIITVPNGTMIDDPAHWSVLPQKAWEKLFRKVGFFLEDFEIGNYGNMPQGEMRYLLRK